MQINFTPVKFNYYSNEINNNKLNFPFENKSDVVSFSARDFLSLPEEKIFKQIIKSVKKTENFLGLGSSAEVYKIEGTNYCVRLPFDKDDEKDEQMIYFCSELNFDVQEKDKINHVVANIGNGGTIMKKINGKPVLSVSMTRDDVISSATKVAQLPLSAYTNLLHQICDAYQKDMIFDAYGTNVIADTQNLVAIDFNKMNPRYKEPLKPLISMYESLVCIKEVPTKVENTIIKKLLKAALKEIEPGKKPCIDLNELDTLDFVSWLYRFHKINDLQFEDLWDSFNDIRNYKNVELSGLNSEPVLARKIAETSNLIEQIF